MGVQGPGPSLGLPTLRLGFRRTEGHDVVPQYRLTICSFAHFHNNAFAFNTLLKSPKHHLIFLQRQLERLWQLCCTRTRGILWWWRGTRQEWQCWATWAREGQEEGGEGQVWQKGWKQRGWQRWSASWWRRRRGWICRRRSREWMESAEKGENATQGLHTGCDTNLFTILLIITTETSPPNDHEFKREDLGKSWWQWPRQSRLRSGRRMRRPSAWGDDPFRLWLKGE